VAIVAPCLWIILGMTESVLPTQRRQFTVHVNELKSGRRRAEWMMVRTMMLEELVR
jgi:hypothetical protein